MIIRLNSFPTPLNLDTCVHDTLYIFIFMISLFFISTRTSLIDILLQLNDKLISLRVLFDIRNKISRYEVVRSIGSRFFVFEKNSRMKSVMRCYPFLVSFFLLQIFLFSFSLLLFFFFWRFIYLHTIFFLFLLSFRFFFSSIIPPFSLFYNQIVTQETILFSERSNKLSEETQRIEI